MYNATYSFLYRINNNIQCIGIDDRKGKLKELLGPVNNNFYNDCLGFRLITEQDIIICQSSTELR